LDDTDQSETQISLSQQQELREDQAWEEVHRACDAPVRKAASERLTDAIRNLQHLMESRLRRSTTREEADWEPPSKDPCEK